MALRLAIRQALLVAFGAALLPAPFLLGCGDGSPGEEPRAKCTPVRQIAGQWSKARPEAPHQEPPTDLQPLADQLVRCRTLVGLRLKRVRQLLGKPTPGGYVHPGFNWAFYLGGERSTYATIDSEWLAISFTPDGMVDRTAIYVD
jgi:hypothetical protein